MCGIYHPKGSVIKPRDTNRGVGVEGGGGMKFYPYKKKMGETSFGIVLTQELDV